MDLNPSPTSLGLPWKFQGWRTGQFEAIKRSAETAKRYVAHAFDTGFGKSLTYMGLARYTKARTLVLTATRGLQNQLAHDFAPSPEYTYTDVRGKSNYVCVALERGSLDGFGRHYNVTVNRAPCTWGVQCHLRTGGCTYYDAISRAQQSDIVVTNYAFQLAQGLHGGDIGSFDLIVLDEAHEILTELSNALRVEMTHEELHGFPGPTPGTKLAAWAKTQISINSGEAGLLAAGLKAKKYKGKEQRAVMDRVSWLMERISKLESLSRVDVGGWTASRTEIGIVWECVWPAPYFEKLIVGRTKKVVFASATLRPKLIQLLGVPASEVEWLEMGGVFPAVRRPIYRIPTARLDHKSSPADFTRIVERIDEIIASRPDRKGIIHTVSYSRAKMLVEKSLFGAAMVTHTPTTAREVIERFKRDPNQRILVSPSVSTGYDFPYSECEYQIVMKLSFPDMRSPLMAARSKRDPEYPMYLAMIALVQQAGRGMRAADDQCEVFILDDNAEWFLRDYGARFAPRAFAEAYKLISAVPTAPPKLGVKRV